MSAGKVDVLAVMDAAATFAEAYRLNNSAADYRVAGAAVADLIEKADTAAKLLHNFIEARAVSESYRPHLDELNAALARIGGAP